MKTKKILLVALLLFTTIALTACSSKSNKVEDIAGYEKYETENYEIQYPKDWIMQEQNKKSGTAQIEVIFAAADNTQTVNIVSEVLKSSLDKYMDLSITSLKTAYKITDDIVKEKVTVNGLDGYSIKYTMAYSGTELDLIQYAFEKGDTKYILTTQGVDGENLGVKVIETFVLK